jgi:exodeoxyribonuclease VII large subunit
MDNQFLEKLKGWRLIKAREENLPVFRVFANKTLESITAMKPKNKEELLTIKGIKERKFEKYGQDILALVNGSETKGSLSPVSCDDSDKKPYTVSRYLNLLNSKLQEQKARIKGEISSLDIKERYLFFSIKDKDDESLLGCFMWQRDYQLSGVEFKEGVEIIIEGFPEVYKPIGRMTFRTSMAELVGEGALKKAYERLKKKLKDKGLFSPERKKMIPDFPQDIGLVTSETGAVIHDFLNNLGKYGYRIKFFNSRVEGQAAARDLLSAVNYFDDKDIDVLVIIRGGGSLESLQAFNNEVLVRKIADFKKPVICGIGHDKDIPLASMTADLMVSTPTVAAVKLNKSWDSALDSIRVFEKDIIYKYQKVLADKNYELEIIGQKLWQKADFIFKKVKDVGYQLMDKLNELGHKLNEIDKILKEFLKSILVNFQRRLGEINKYLDTSGRRLKTVDPKRQLRLGYSIVLKGAKVIKSVKQVNKNDGVNIKIYDGEIKSRVEEVINK